jgi:hypothetical protein
LSRHKGDVINTATPGANTFTMIVITTEYSCRDDFGTVFDEYGTTKLLNMFLMMAKENWMKGRCGGLSK